MDRASERFYNYLLLSGFYFLILLSSEVLQKGCPFVCNWGNPLANVPYVGGNTLANLLQGVRGCWQPSSKFVIGF